MKLLIFVILSFGCVSMIASEKCSRPKNGLKFKSCCNIPKLMDISMFMQCKSQFPANFTFPPNPRKLGDMSASAMKLPDTSCFVECIFNNSGVIKNGKPDRDALISVLATKVKNNPDFTEMLNKAVDACMSLDSKAMYDKILQKVRQSAACDPEAAALVRCVKMTVFKECPSSKNWLPSDECSQIKTFVNDCILTKFGGDGATVEPNLDDQ